MLLNILLDEDHDDSTITAIYQVGPYVVQIKQKPGEGHEVCKDDTPASASDGASQLQSCKESFPNVGFMVWQAAFVLAEYLIRNPPCGVWEDIEVLEIGAGVGTLGIALGMAGANVLMTDLPHIVPLMQDNASANNALCKHEVRVSAFPWGEDPEAAGLRRPKVLVAADVLYEPQYYGKLLDSLVRLSGPDVYTYVCYRHRGSYLEETFESMAQESGFVVEKKPDGELSAEYQGRGFQLYQLFMTNGAQKVEAAPS